MGQQIEQISADASDVQLIDIDRFFPKIRQKIIYGETHSHNFNHLSEHIKEGKPAVMFSHKDGMFIEVFIDHIQKKDDSGLVFWREIELKIASS